jgi:hypothetical protein
LVPIAVGTISGGSAPNDVYMMLYRQFVVVVAAAAICSLHSSTAAAASQPQIVDVTFVDADQLKSTVLSGQATVVSGAPRTVHIILTRPRLSFVPELLASIQCL